MAMQPEGVEERSGADATVGIWLASGRRGLQATQAEGS